MRPVSAIRRTTEAPKRRTAAACPTSGAMPSRFRQAELTPRSAMRMSRPPPAPTRRRRRGRSAPRSTAREARKCFESRWPARVQSRHIRAPASRPRRRCRRRRRTPCLRRKGSRPALRARPRSPRGVGERLDHRAVERVEFVGAPERDRRSGRRRPVRHAGSARAPRAAAQTNRLGAEQRDAIVFKSAATRNGNSPAPVRRACRSAPGAISMTVSPSRSSRITKRSVT